MIDTSQDDIILITEGITGLPVSIPKDPTMYLQYQYHGKFCGNCNLCCSHSAVTIFAAIDDIQAHPLKKKICEEPETWLIPQRKNGDCVYLEDGKCGIHDNLPKLCKTFDCRVAYLHYKFTGEQLYAKEIIKKGKIVNRKHPIDLTKIQEA